jgi:hypothetical protein
MEKVSQDMCKIPSEDESTLNDVMHGHSALGKALGENLQCMCGVLDSHEFPS